MGYTLSVYPACIDWRMMISLHYICFLYSFGIMGQCWQMEPRDRPTFKEICSTLSKFIECEAGYLQFGFNPFTDGGEGGGGEVEGGEEGRRNNEDEKEEEEKEFI